MKNKKVKASLCYGLAGFIFGLILLSLYLFVIKTLATVQDSEGYFLLRGIRIRDLLPPLIQLLPLVLAVVGAVLAWTSPESRAFARENVIFLGCLLLLMCGTYFVVGRGVSIRTYNTVSPPTVGT